MTLCSIKLRRRVPQDCKQDMQPTALTTSEWSKCYSTSREKGWGFVIDFEHVMVRDLPGFSKDGADTLVDIRSSGLFSCIPPVYSTSLFSP